MTDKLKIVDDLLHPVRLYLAQELAGKSCGEVAAIHDIGWAVKQLQDGQRVRRAGWNGKGMFLVYVKKDYWSSVAWSAYNPGTVDWKGNLPFVAMYTADKYFVPWLCSQTDLLAIDWEIVS